MVNQATATPKREEINRQSSQYLHLNSVVDLSNQPSAKKRKLQTKTANSGRTYTVYDPRIPNEYDAICDRLGRRRATASGNEKDFGNLTTEKAKQLANKFSKKPLVTN